MAFSTKWAFNIKLDTTLAAEKQWVVDVLRQPSTVASGETAPSDTTGPLGSSGKATANYKHGDGTSAGFPSCHDAVQKAVSDFLFNDLALNGTA